MTEKDLGTNATFGVVVTQDGVVLIDPGASFNGAQRIHEAIKTITDKPVKLVINTGSWIKAFEHIATHKPTHIIPGHGHVTDLKQARADTLDYILALRKGITELIDNGGTLDEVSKVDQSQFKKLTGYEMLKGRNANQLFQELEWE